jgi:hypothetical protein
MRKQLKAFREWFVAFLKEYLPWTGTDQFLDSTWGKRFLTVLGGVVVTGASWIISFVANVPSGWKDGFFGAFVATISTAILIFFFSPTSPRQRVPKSRYISGELGWIDKMVNMESAQKVFLNLLAKIAQTQGELTPRIKRHTAAIEKIKRSGRKVFSRMRKEAQKAARSTIDAASVYEEIIPELAESVSFYFDGQLLAVDRTNATNPQERGQLERTSRFWSISAKIPPTPAKRRKTMSMR